MDVQCCPRPTNLLDKCVLTSPQFILSLKSSNLSPLLLTPSPYLAAHLLLVSALYSIEKMKSISYIALIFP